MMNERVVVDRHDHMCTPKCVSWSAILAGAIVGIGLSFLLNLFSVAIGLVAFKTTQDGVSSFAIGGFIGLIIAAIVSYFFAGWTTGYLVRPFCFKRHLGTVYGFVTWGVALIISSFLLAHMGNYMTYRTSVMTNAGAPTYVAATNDDRASTTVSTRSNESSSDVMVNGNKATEALITVAFATFILFLIGAISSCVGAHCAFGCRKGDRDDRGIM